MKFVVPMRAVILAHLFYVVSPAGEADYTLDDSFWNEESPVGEVERLLKEYRQNQEMVRKIGSHYYQIIYPVQLRHHEKMGISTREVGAAKVRNRSRNKRNSNTFPNRGGNRDYNYQAGPRGRTRTGKHFHRTSLLIKAFNHKFRLDLELNTQLLAPNIMQKYVLPSGYPQETQNEIEHCYYHGTVKDYPGASAAFHTCNGVSGVIHVGNETFVIHPFYGGDLSKHPHIIFEARTKANKGCANSGNLEWRMTRRQKTISGIIEEQDRNGAGRYRRDVREATKYIETALIIDKAMFDKRNGSTRAEVVHDAIQVANIADLYFRTLNTRVSVVYIETWQGANQVQIDGGKDISKAISNFNDYTARKLFKIDKDTTQLLTGETFSGGEAGMAVPETVCTQKAVGISVDINVYEPHLLAGTMAHMIGHNIGMGHDDGREECFCRDWHGCIMAQTIVGLENVQPYKFSECSRSDYIDALRLGHGICLLNKPNELEVRRNCGNGIVEEGEECDCGTIDECSKTDPCCDPITCKLIKEAQCASGACCDNCALRSSGFICRDSLNECDLPEVCTGDSGQCPPDVHKKNGLNCGPQNQGYCFNGMCPTLASQCERIWGYGGTSADRKCYEQFNSKGSINGHCGVLDKNYIKCDSENVQCGALQCKEGDRQPTIDGLAQNYSRTIISIQGVEYECKATSGTIPQSDFPAHGLVLDGTPCGDNLVCVNQTCVSIYPHIDPTKCASNHNNMECSGHGVCTNQNKCFCDYGWGGPDCSLQIAVTTTVPPTTTSAASAGPTPTNDPAMKRIEIKYGDGVQEKISTLTMVIILVVIVKCVFISFALMAVCYRRKTTRLKYDPPYVKKPMGKPYGGAATANHHSVEEVSLDGSNKIITYANQPGFRDHKMQIRRMPGSGSEEDPTHSGEEETVSIIDLPPNNMSKLPEKGILKKHGFGLVIGDSCKDKWGDDSQSDNLELIAQQETSVSQTATGLLSATGDVERTLKSLNGYHEDILEALRNAASHRGTGAGNTPSGSGSLSEEMLRKQLEQAALGYSEATTSYKRSGSKSSSKENICDVSQSHTVIVEGQPNPMMHHHRPPSNQEEEEVPSLGPLRIRNLEDLIRQLEHHSSRHMSPSGSEDIRMSETEADRHYRLDSSAACSESSQGSNQQLSQQQKTATIHSSYSNRCRPRSDDESRFVYGRYRHPPSSATSRHSTHQTHSPHSFSHHTHHGHAHGHPSHGPHSSHHSSHTHLHQDEDGIYETADHHDRQVDPRDTPDSESDEFIQAQQPLARWASEDVVSVVVLNPAMGQAHGPSSTGAIIHGDLSMGLPTTTGTQHQPRDYYPSPPSTETESSGSVIQPPQPQQRRGHIQDGQGHDGQQQQMDSTGRFPEYKH